MGVVQQGQVILEETSYRRELSLPGVWISRSETAHMAAQRELAKNLSLGEQAHELRESWAFSERSADWANIVTIVSMKISEPRRLQVVSLEILRRFWLHGQAPMHHITGDLRNYLLEKPDP